MSYSMISWLPPIYGLYASTIPLIIYAILGTSRQLAVGPVAMVSLLTAAGVGAIAQLGTDQYIALTILLALLAGGIQFLMGLFRLGFLVNFLSHPVISGFSSAAAIIIGLSQLKHLLGIDIPRSEHFYEVLIHAAENIQATNLMTLAIGIVGILLIKFSKKIHKAIPGALVAVVVGILAVWVLNLQASGVQIVGEVPKGLPAFQVPGFDMSQISALLPIALTIALISFMESIAVAKAVQQKHKNYKLDANQELMALGAAQIGGAFFQSYPVTGGFSRTAINDQAGAKTGLASIISALLIVLTLLFLTPLFYFLPKAILASLIMVAVAGLIDYKEAKYLWKVSKTDFWMLMATFLGTLFLGIEQGILIGVALSVGFLIYQTTRPHYAILGKIPGKDLYKNIDRFPDLEVRPDILILRFDARLYFANINYFQEIVEASIQEKGPSLKLFILDADSINSVDSSALHLLETIHQNCRKNGIELYFAGLKGPVRDAFAAAGLLEKFDNEKFFLKIQHAV